MQRPEIIPRAYLHRIRNVRKGLRTRTRMIMVLEESPSTVKELSDRLGLTSSAIRRQLRNLEAEGIVRHVKTGRKTVWKLTGVGQRTLEESMA